MLFRYRVLRGSMRFVLAVFLAGCFACSSDRASNDDDGALSDAEDETDTHDGMTDSDGSETEADEETTDSDTSSDPLDTVSEGLPDTPLTPSPDDADSDTSDAPTNPDNDPDGNDPDDGESTDSETTDNSESTDTPNGAATDDGEETPVADIPLPYRYATSVTDDRLVFEVDSVVGKEPRESSVSALVDRFSPLLDKPGGISVKQDGLIESRGEDHGWTFEELDELARSQFDDDEPAGTVVIHAMFLDGHYVSESGGTVLGIAWANRYIAMFTDVLNDSCASAALLGSVTGDPCEAAEFAVWSHEVGHVLGLVNNGLPMQTPHQDEERGKHDVREGCLMYWAYDGPSLVDETIARLTRGEAEIDFCEESLEDLEAARAAEF